LPEKFNTAVELWRVMGIGSVRYADQKYMGGPTKNSAATTAESISTMQDTGKGTKWLPRTRI